MLSTVVLGLKTSSGGPLTKNQAAMDVHHYELRIALDPEKKTIGGTVTIGFNLKRKPHNPKIDDFHCDVLCIKNTLPPICKTAPKRFPQSSDFGSLFGTI